MLATSLPDLYYQKTMPVKDVGLVKVGVLIDARVV
jgi:hypothetical protein